jgi:ubiquinone biosynthesis protein
VSQVHRAVLPDGSEVAVKVQRPGAADAMALDLAILGRAAALAHRFAVLRRHVDLRGFVAEVERGSAQEMDFRREAEVSERFARNFRGTAGVRIPRVHWRHTTRRLLVTEFVEGRKISDLSLRGHGKYPELAERGAHLFFRQVLEHGLFHADLHPANLLVTDRGEIAYLDLGIWGELDREERHAVVGALTGLLCRDGHLALRHLARLGVRVEPHRAGPFVADVREVLEEAVGPTLGEVDVARIGRGILAAARRHRVLFPHKYALLVKALLTIEGAARTLHGRFDPEKAARDYLAGWFASEARLSMILEGTWRAALLGALLEGSPTASPSPAV